MSIVKVVDRSRWLVGPWNDEIDHDEWVTDAGLQAMMRRNAAGAWCGYVAVPREHVLHGLDYSDEVAWLGPVLAERCNQPLGNQGGLGVLINLVFGEVKPTLEMCVRVHGGITFCGDIDGSRWFGFDCSHDVDTMPVYGNLGGSPNASYRDRAYVRLECEQMARQLSDIATRCPPSDEAVS